MGIEAQAFLVYGVDLGDNVPDKFNPNKNSYIDFEDVICEAAGLTEPPYSSPEYREYSAKRKALLEKCPVDLCTYGDDDDRQYALFVRGKNISAHNLEPTRVNLTSLTISEEHLAAAAAFCQEYGVRWANPSWLLITRRC